MRCINLSMHVLSRRLSFFLPSVSKQPLSLWGKTFLRKRPCSHLPSSLSRNPLSQIDLSLSYSRSKLSNRHLKTTSRDTALSILTMATKGYDDGAAGNRRKNFADYASVEEASVLLPKIQKENSMVEKEVPDRDWFEGTCDNRAKRRRADHRLKGTINTYTHSTTNHSSRQTTRAHALYAILTVQFSTLSMPNEWRPNIL